MPSYNVTLFQPPGYVHSMALWEVAKLLFFTLDDLGYRASLSINQLDRSAINILLGYHLLEDSRVLAGYYCIVYQLEHLDEREGWFNQKLLATLARVNEVWDYSPVNIEFLRHRQIENVKFLPLGYHPKLQTIAPAEPDIDVLFYGSPNIRRERILDSLGETHYVQSLFGTYAEERDGWIARSKLILNMHYFGGQTLEAARVAYLLNNGRCVVSEASDASLYDDMVISAPYESLVDACVQYLCDDHLRHAFAAESFSRFRELPMTDFVRDVLGG